MQRFKGFLEEGISKSDRKIADELQKLIDANPDMDQFSLNATSIPAGKLEKFIQNFRDKDYGDYDFPKMTIKGKHVFI